MTAELSPQAFTLYLELLVKALRGARSTLRLTYPEYVSHCTEVIDLPRGSLDGTQVFLIKAHHLAVTGRHVVYTRDREASNLLDAIHNIPYGLLGRYDGGWHWWEHLPSTFREHEEVYLGGLMKYTGMLTAVPAG